MVGIDIGCAGFSPDSKDDSIWQENPGVPQLGFWIHCRQNRNVFSF